MKASTIGWTDYSGGDLNFVTGCTPASEGCQHCYARAIYKRFGRDFAVTCHEDKLDRLGGTRFPDVSPKAGAGHRPMAFVCDTGDPFHESVPAAFIDSALYMMAVRDDVVWQVLTKRPAVAQARMRHLVGQTGRIPRNIWLGVTAENQARADERIPLLLDTPAAIRFVSVEPMLGPVFLGPYLHGLSWVICGAESGSERRPFSRSEATRLYVECHDAGVAYFGKQDSAQKPGAPLLIYGETVHQWPQEA